MASFSQYSHFFFSAIIVHFGRYSALLQKKRAGIKIRVYSPLSIGLRERRPPHVLTDVEPAAGHEVLTDLSITGLFIFVYLAPALIALPKKEYGNKEADNRVCLPEPEEVVSCKSNQKSYR